MTRGARIAGFAEDTLVINVPMRDGAGHVRPLRMWMPRPAA
ncbi:hypothetical protein RAA17_03260 [Komagataeibacter rhaeticus]|nr:hypothetical protein [Komagataeibacter rhaeticus]